MILVFTGAGSSKAVSNRYPTTTGFFDNLPEEIRNDVLFRSIVGYLSSNNNQKIIDIEQVLWGLHELKKMLIEIKENKGILGWFLNQDRLASIINSGNGYSGHLTATIPVIFKMIDSLVDRINHRVYFLYNHEPEAKDLSNNWMPLLEELSKKNPQIEIFTTNYDVVIESALKKAQLSGEIITGRNTSGILNTLDVSCWAGNNDSKTAEPLKRFDSSIALRQQKIRLTKLHGSIDWVRRIDDEISVGNPTFTGKHENHVLIYPGYKGVPEEEPFKLFHMHFEKELKKAKAIIFIGFSFRDEHINDLIKRNISNNAKIIVLDPQASSTAPEFLRKRTEHIDKGFDKEAVLHCMTILMN